MTGISILLAAVILSLPLFRLAHIGHKLMAGITELNAALNGLDASVQALVAAAGTITLPDLQPQIDRINADKAAIDTVVANLPHP